MDDLIVTGSWDQNVGIWKMSEFLKWNNKNKIFDTIKYYRTIKFFHFPLFKVETIIFFIINIFYKFIVLFNSQLDLTFFINLELFNHPAHKLCCLSNILC